MTAAIRFYPRSELLQTERGWRQVIPHIRTKIDDGIAKVENIACRSGCAHCCKLQVHALPHEAMDVVDHVRYSDRFDRETRATILAKLRDVAIRTEGMTPQQYRDADIACPFLGDNDLCMVYSVRPLACRAFGSTNVSVCDLSVPDDGEATFKVVPDSLVKLLATSGLFYALFVKACVEWWEGGGVTAVVEEGEAEKIAQVQQLIEAGVLTRQ